MVAHVDMEIRESRVIRDGDPPKLQIGSLGNGGSSYGGTPECATLVQRLHTSSRRSRSKRDRACSQPRCYAAWRFASVALHWVRCAGLRGGTVGIDRRRRGAPRVRPVLVDAPSALVEVGVVVLDLAHGVGDRPAEVGTFRKI